MTNTFKIEIIREIKDLENIKKEWDSLYESSDNNHPFASFEWILCFYKSYLIESAIRVVLLKKDGKITAILPGFIEQLSHRKIPFKLNTFHFAVNAHTPRCGLIAKKNDLKSINLILVMLLKRYKKIDLFIFPNVYQQSNLNTVINKLKNRIVYIENMYKSPAYDISAGWENYLKTRSKSFRKSLKKANTNLSFEREIKLECLYPKTDSSLVINRLKKIDSKTWQYENNTGLFSNEQNSTFYTLLMTFYANVNDILISFLSVDNKDIGYEISVEKNKSAYFLKTGFDPIYRKNSPGNVIKALLTEHYSSKGFNEIDLVGESTDGKRRWATHERIHRNYWIINFTFKGLMLSVLLQIKKYQNLISKLRLRND